MLAELAAANAAFAVIKATLNNGGEIMSAGSKVFDYFTNKMEIQERLNEKAKNGKPSSDWEEFQALETLKEQEAHLKAQMIYAGRPGMWEDWQKFQAEAARKRREAREAAVAEAKKKAKRKQEIAEAVAAVFGVGVLAALILYFVHLYFKYLK